MSFVSMNTWVKRFLNESIHGLKTRAGRKPIMDCSDEQAVRLAIEQDRQSVRKAKEAWQQATGKQVSDMTVVMTPVANLLSKILQNSL